MTDTTELTANEIVAAVRAGTTSCEAVVTAFLERIVAEESQLRAWAHVDADLALEQARVLDAEAPNRPLHGVPVGVKDIVDTEDQPTAYGSPIYEGHRPVRDATAVARLREAGAVVLGKTVTTEFALFAPGPTVNPFDSSRTPGGSSSGSAAAVAAHMVPLAIGTQTAGSVVRPASFCGVVGVKPTFGRVPTDGVKACAPSLDTVGIFAKDVEDAALALGAMANDPEGFALHPLGPTPRIGVCRTPQWSALEPATQQIFEDAADELRGHADVVDVELPDEFAALVDAQKAIMAAEVLEALDAERQQHAQQLSTTLRAYLLEALEHSDGYADAMALTHTCRGMLDEVFAGLDAIFAPSVVGEAPDIATTGDPLLCRMWTLLGVPSVAVPGLKGPDGLPLGVQVVADTGADGVALSVAGFVGSLLA